MVLENRVDKDMWFGLVSLFSFEVGVNWEKRDFEVKINAFFFELS